MRLNKAIKSVLLLAPILLASCEPKPSTDNGNLSSPTTTTPTTNTTGPTTDDIIDDGNLHSVNNKVFPMGTKDDPFTNGVCKSLNIHLLEMNKKYGDSLIIKCAAEKKEDDFTMLIDVGDDTDGKSAVNDALKTIADNEIDFAVFTHGHADHINGFENAIGKNVDNVTIKNILDFGYKYETKSYTTKYEQYRDKYVKEKKANYCTAFDAVNNRVCSSKYYLAQDLTFEIFDTGHYINNPGTIIKNAGANDTSIAGILKYKDFSFFLSGDLDQEIDLLKLNPNLETVNLMKAGHHGSDTSNSDSLLQKIKPENIIISAAAVAKANPDKPGTYYLDGRANDHPNPIALKRMFNSSAGTNVYTNLTMGTIVVDVDVTTLQYTITGLGANRLVYEISSESGEVIKTKEEIREFEKTAKLVNTYFYNNVQILNKGNKTLKELVDAL